MSAESAADEDDVVDERSSDPKGRGLPTGERERSFGESELLDYVVRAPERTTAVLLAALAYLWLASYVAGTVLGLRSDPVVANDWLTLLFTTYALSSSLALAYRFFGVALGDMTDERLVDVVALTWLTAFYFVWTMARTSVSASTTVGDLYGPVLVGRPDAVVSLGVVVVSAVAAAGLVSRSGRESTLFATEFRTALVTLPCLVTTTVILVRPTSGSVVWPLVGGAFLGTLLVGLTRIRPVLTWIARAAFAACSLATWAAGALAWALVHRRRPPEEGAPTLFERVDDGAYVVFGERVEFGTAAGGEPKSGDETEATAESHE